jgi:YVTN family beta-propeller protein
MRLTATGALSGTYKAGDGPLAAVCSDGVVYVVNNGGDSVTKLNATDGTNLGSITVGRSPIGIAISGSNVWVTNSGSNTVTKR